MMKKQYQAVIIEDIAIARESLKKDLELFCPEIEIVGMAEGVVSGVKIIKKYDPEIIFLDVELTDGDGFDLLEILEDIRARVIFTTGSEHYAIKAFRFAAVDYLLKPIQAELLREGVLKAISQLNQHSSEQFNVLREQLSDKVTDARIALHTQEKVEIRHISEIVFCQAYNNYTHFIFSDEKKLLVTKTLKEYERLLSEKGFIRVHQSFLVNIEHIKAYHKKEGGNLLMSNGDLVPVSFRKRAELNKVLGKIG